jgi:hypothetical protein
MPEGLNRGAVTVESPRDPSHGDLATNAAMVLAKAAGTNPRALATLLVAELEKLAAGFQGRDCRAGLYQPAPVGCGMAGRTGADRDAGR